MVDVESILESHLAPYAMRASQSRGRPHPDHGTAYRGIYQRDRDRIVHSSAFRRLQYKTQVFVSVMEGDYFRNRLTHTLEVTQIARTIARALRLNEDLTEALALAHDLGHGPFGHSGENALDDVMSGKGGFDHNAQGLRVVDFLEQRYPRFPGLNLTYETREGYVKNYVQDGRPGRPRSALGFAGNEMPSLEVQLVGHADEIAYDTHDCDDGLVSGALDEDSIRSVTLWRRVEEEVLREHAVFKSDHRMRWRAVVRRLIGTLVSDLLEETRRRLKEHAIGSIQDVRQCEHELVGFSPELAPQKLELETFLMENFYKGARVRERTNMWQTRLKTLFSTFLNDPARLPEEQRKRAEASGDLDRVICDYLAGMTDRFASKQWEALGVQG
ncbi:MAG TPA: deoxyguanosinetriphosphate triphosphohydrolase [Planctomycetota bacterium]|nr:deoxyguanosinetriphosphate triphosphohydrolase [Planctomycetota bacterium]